MSRAASTRGLSYTVKSREVAGGEFRAFACASCARCGVEGALRLNRPGNNPEFVQKQFVEMGWHFDSWNARRVLCPGCQKTAAQERRGESPNKESVVATVKTQGTPAAKPTLTLAAAPSKTQLTVKEREMLRDFLAGLFDADKGFYLDAYTDARVAEEKQIPEVLVRDYREVAFGPLRAVPEIEHYKVPLAELEARAKEISIRLASLTTDIVETRSNLEETLRGMGIR